MGAAGIICSTSEMSAKGGVGMRIDLDKVPARQQNMKAWELLLSESQERMLLVAEKGRESEVQRVFEKWDLPCSVIGEVTDDGILRFYMNGELEAELPAHDLVLGGGAPQYEREYKKPAYLEKLSTFDAAAIPVPAGLKEAAEKLIALPTIASKKWIYTQYDSMVGTVNTSTNAPSAAPVVLVKGTDKGIAVTTDCNSRYVYADPYKGAMIAVSEAARNIVCSGGLPLGVTNCLNFGNPYDPEVYYQFVHAIKGMGDACRRFDTPVTGGNVSFYNQNPDGPVYPTPTIGMVGLLEDVSQRMTLDFKEQGDVLYLLGTCRSDLNSSEYLHNVLGISHSPAPHFDIEEEYALQQLVASLIKAQLVRSAHDVSEGGLFISLCESGFNRELGFSVISNNSVRKDAWLFGESQSRVLVSVAIDRVAEFERAAGAFPAEKIGVVTEGDIVIDGEFWGAIDIWKERYDNAIGNYLAKEEAGSALSAV
ncbi:MAG TPA: AIR synthase-related protein, partial [Chitinophagaceae bacterium]|nr:AIR synthase-related protein [Chitinophagaceae bacterium]